jgi:oligopeptide/dipeptide ABC transporter ATP-binding protein
MHQVAGGGGRDRWCIGGSDGVTTTTLAAGARSSQAGNSALIELEDVSRVFETPAGQLRAVDGVSLSLGAGEILCLVGESGCGKTTTGKMLAGLVRPSSGRLLFEGSDVWDSRGRELATFRRSVQLVHQDPYASLNPARTVFQTLSAPLARHRLVRGQRETVARVLELLRLVDLTPAEDFLGKYPHQLSGGQRQRVSIARALTVHPRFIVADEAVSMVDVSIRISLLNVLLRLRDELGMSFVLITHDLAVARYFGQHGRIGVMYLGRIVELAPTDALIADPAHPYSAALIAAIPEADPELTRRKQRIALRSADVPSLLRLPAGCAFHPRCPRFESGLCDVRLPRLLSVASMPASPRSVACHVAVRERTGSHESVNDTAGVA